MRNKCSLTVIILTYNEEIHLARAIKSVSSIAKRVIVVDSYSSDETVQIAVKLGAEVFTNKFVNQSRQFQWALDSIRIDTDWVMRLDADEIVEQDLCEEIESRLPLVKAETVGINFKRKHIFLGKWIKHGGRYPLILLRMWRNGKGKIEDRWMDEHIVVWGGKVVTFEGGFSDHNLNDLTFFTQKHNKYATREAVDIINQKSNLFPRDIELSTSSSSFQASMKRYIKENLYNKIPFQISALLYFLFRYIVQLGFLDGKPGVTYHFLQGFWYRFLVGAKVYELEKELRNETSKYLIIKRLSELTGLDLPEE